MANVVKSEEDIICSGKQIKKNVRLDLSNISSVEIVKNDTQDVMFNGKKVATISGKGIDFHVPIMIDGIEIAKETFKETRARGVV